MKSRALPDDFDTTQVLRSPFDHKSGSEMAFPPGRHYVGPNSDPNALKMMTEGLQRPNDDDYVISPLSSASTTNGSHFSSITPRKNSSSVPHSANDAGVPERIPELQRNDRSFPFIRSSSFSEACAQPPFNAPLAPSHGFPRPGEQLAHPGIDYARRAMDYRLAGPRGMMVGYDQRHLDESVSPTDQETHVPSDQGMFLPDRG